MSETLRHPAPSTIDIPGPTPRERWRRWRLSAFASLLEAVLRIAHGHPALWRWLARGYHPALDRFAAANARTVCALAAIEVPAYRRLLSAGRTGARRRLRDFPETDKENYVAGYDAASRCWGGRLPDRGVVVDESAGSSGRPFNWPRGERELRAVHRDIAGYTSLVFPMRRPFVINAYSMGAWATGTTTGNAMAGSRR